MHSDSPWYILPIFIAAGLITLWTAFYIPTVVDMTVDKHWGFPLAATYFVACIVAFILLIFMIDYICDFTITYLNGKLKRSGMREYVFEEWFEQTYPEGSIISNPNWHARRIYRAIINSDQVYWPSPKDMITHWLNKRNAASEDI